ncbi:M28 family peptidase [Pendulispora albinea]|uniref:M28 family peptidase n=1 Tax=Pendulispora albinea TaxID=2741071 RepID=A0ABZ2M7F7_9BACT
MKIATSLLVLMAAAALGCASEIEHAQNETKDSDVVRRAHVTASDAVLDGSILGHLRAFQQIANRHGGVRAAGTAGYDESADYVAGKLTAAGFDVTKQAFPFSFSGTLAEKLAVDGVSVPIRSMKFSVSTPAGGIDSTLFVLTTPGCTIGDYAGQLVAGKIVLVKRGGREGCFLRDQERAAAEAGAAAVVIYNHVPGNFTGTLPEGWGRIPAGGITTADGESLRQKHGAPTHLEIRELIETRTTYNVIAETKTGRKDRVVMAGAHLDSVQRGPGINDNGSGSAVLLEDALRRGGSPAVTNALRFAWWGAEELGLLGAHAYIQSLTAEQRARIAMYLNFDMVASPNAGYFVMDGDDSEHTGRGPGPAGSAEIEAAFLTEFAALGVPTEASDLNDSSDQGEFLEVGIASGGFDTGSRDVKTEAQAAKWGGTAGIAFDPCYHEACDTSDNINRHALVRNARVMERVITKFGNAITSR